MDAGVYFAKGLMKWRVPPVNAAELGSSIGQQSPTPALAASLTRLALAIEAQTKALDRMAESNQGLIRAMAEQDVMEVDGDEASPTSYLNQRKS